MITERDTEIVRLLDLSGGLDVLALRCMLGLGQTVMYRRLGRLQQYGMVAAARPFQGMPALFIPTRRGLREVLGRDDLDPPSVSATSYNHQVQVGRVIARLHRRGVQWESSRVTRRNQRAARERGDVAQVRRYALTLSWLERSHLPDALIWPSEAARLTEQPAAIEVELTQKSRRRLDEILLGYATHLGMCGVVYICGSDAHQAVLAAVERGHHESVASVTTLSEFGPGVAVTSPPAASSWMNTNLTPGPISELERFFRRGVTSRLAAPLPGI